MNTKKPSADRTDSVDKGKLNTISGFVKEVIRRFTKSDTLGLSAQLAYFFLLSLFPLLIFALALIPYLPITQQGMLNFFSEFAPGEIMSVIESTITEVNTGDNTGILSIGLLGTLWSASYGMNALMKSFNQAYEVEETRSFIVARGMAIVWTIGMIGVFIIALLLPIFGHHIGDIAFSAFGLSDQFLTIWNVLRFGVTPFVLIIVFTGLYAFVPNVKIRFVSVIPGAILATAGWLIISFLFAYYVGRFSNYASTYGSVGGIIVLMVWLYLSGIIMMIGAQVNAIMAAKKRHTES
ncbi:YihY/virulence factor BrkB family protein [Jeotgalibacillus marinus]|uniref:YihY/virulence factor BrkB family protein n=1 Tax=Jeotgalibacillus marinus TaxID=86667 RepID=A0ABV3Q068_9BACL